MIKILLVDDIKENQYMLESLLKGNGYSTVSANNGEEALELALKDPPNIIIADILMPIMDGYTLCREWKKDERLKSIPFVFYTATYTHPKDEEFAMSLGADMFILKPQEPDIFISIIKKVLSDFNIQEFKAHKPSVISEETVLKEYNETLIRKLEDRMLRSEESEKKLRNYAAQLEQEIEQRKQITKALEESEEKFRLTTENSADAIFITDKQRQFVYINAQATNLLGYSINEMVQMSIVDIAPKNDVELHLHLFQELLDKGKLFAEIKMLKKNGDLVPVDLNAILLPNGMVYGSCRDITMRKHTEDQLTKSEQRFRTLAETAPVGIFRTDANGATTYVNPRWSEITQQTLSDAQGYGWVNAVHPDDRDMLTQSWQLAVQAKTASEIEYRFKHHDGSVAWVIGKATPQKDEHGVTIGYIGTLSEITERKLMELDLIAAKEKAEENDRLKTAFLHNISHEIRTPMNAIVGFSDLLLETNLDYEKYKNYVDIINKSSNQLLSIISDIISISTIEAGQEKVHEKSIDLNSLIVSIHQQFNLVVKNKSVEFRYKALAPDEDAMIVSDEIKLIEILSNLVNNAFKFTDKGSVEFGYCIKNNEIEFMVKDTGIGIPESKFESIFKRFFQVETDSDRTYGGSGLGLSISKAYVEMLGGKIWVNSQVNSGSTFYFTIPYKKAIATKIADAAIHSEKKEPKSTKTILVAEDEDINYNYLFELFSGSNFKLLRARNGIEAIEMLNSSSSIDLILMDIKMPIMNGYEATRRIKATNPKIPIIAQTAYAHEVDKAKAFENGCDDYISKPFKKDMLISKINDLLLQFKA